MIFSGQSKILAEKAGANTTVGGFFACSSTSILVISLHQTRRTYTAFHWLLMLGSLAETELSSTKVLTLFPVLSEMKTSFKVLRLYVAPSAAECSL